MLRYFSTSLDAVSPSSFSRLKAWGDGGQCPLPLLWRGDHPLPKGPKALMGDIVHHVMQHFSPGSNLNDLWNGKANEINRKLLVNWIFRGLYPIEKTASGYTLKKKLALARLGNKIKGDVPEVKNPAQVVMRDDQLIESRDRKVRGKPDLVIKCGEDYTIIDYKSGDIFEDDPESGEPIIKGEYRLQLMLYAALLRENGKNIDSAILQTIDGKKEMVELSHEADILKQASRLLDEFNKKLEDLSSPVDMAVPKPANFSEGIWGCFGCGLRPVCAPYRRRQTNPLEDEIWPKDIFGTLADKSNGSDGISLRVEMHSGRGDHNVILTDCDSRHPAIANLKKGDALGIFNLKLFRGSYRETPQTCVYQYMDNPTEEWQIHLDYIGEK